VTSVIVHALTTGFFTMTTWCLAGGFAITAIALLARRRQARTRTPLRSVLLVRSAMGQNDSGPPAAPTAPVSRGGQSREGTIEGQVPTTGTFSRENALKMPINATNGIPKVPVVAVKAGKSPRRTLSQAA
jgi:hypothetical protein